MGITAGVDIQCPLETVFAFASDVSNLPLYDQGIHEAKKMTEGLLGVGTIYQLIARPFGIRMVVVLEFTAYEPNIQFAFKVISEPFPVETHYTFTNLGHGTQVRGVREPQPGGFWKWMTPLITSPARKKFETELNRLKAYLEAHS